MRNYRISIECSQDKLTETIATMTAIGIKVEFVDQESLAQAVTNLRMSCKEGLVGTWDCSTEEGREGFDAMIDACDDIAKLLGIELPTHN
jgi:hypothetical protein